MYIIIVMNHGYNSVLLIGNIKQIRTRPYRDGVIVTFFLSVNDRAVNYISKSLQEYQETFRVVFTGNPNTNYEFALSMNPYVQVSGKLHIRSFKERMMNDKNFTVEIRTSPGDILFLGKAGTITENFEYLGSSLEYRFRKV